ncbi:Hypothetical protein CINCED_3A014856 [Cinara cedri]|uniref:Uncharacterized protein n=1 Tax=Cinara cedri TaxID=506608 RepID=A0A5E4NTG1_9HEMI|nr:Hypothetical protein CINCED_3A014856 [Cinara cedri]
MQRLITVQQPVHFNRDRLSSAGLFFAASDLSGPPRLQQPQHNRLMNLGAAQRQQNIRRFNFAQNVSVGRAGTVGGAMPSAPIDPDDDVTAGFFGFLPQQQQQHHRRHLRSPAAVAVAVAVVTAADRFFNRGRRFHRHVQHLDERLSVAGVSLPAAGRRRRSPPHNFRANRL